MASILTNHYAPQQQSHYSYVQQAPQPPPSPPMDEAAKCSLPSISNLLGLADQGSPTSETSPQNREPQQQQAISKPDTRPNSSHYGTPNPASSFAMRSTGALPPTPPMSSDASFDGYHSPSTRSVSQISVVSHPTTHPHGYYYETTPPLEADAHRPIGRVAVPQNAYPPQPYPGASSYLPPAAMAPYYPPMQPTPPPQSQISGLYYQRPLPQQFPPLSVPMGGPNPWQHHHYIAPSAASAFPQSQDRYICSVCNKAFSRPSSLRIHSHSHTGEKPFKCPHVGCGKAFSVRSNMKRHERGCHNFDGSSTPANSSPLIS